MRIGLRLILGFIALAALGAVQGLYLADKLHGAGDEVARIFDQPLAAVNDSRAAWDAFRDASMHAGQILGFTQALDPAKAQAELKQHYDRFQRHFSAAAQKLEGDDARRRADLTAQAAEAWRRQVEAMINGGPRAEIVSPLALQDLRVQVQNDLDALVGIAIAQAARLRGDGVAAAEGAARAALIFVVVLTLASLALGGALAANLARPIRRATDVMARLAAGDLSVEAPDRHRQDEIGAMARALDVFKHAALENQRLRAEQEQRQAEAEAAKTAALTKMAATVEAESGRAVDAVADRTRLMDQDAAAIAASADEVGRSSRAAAESAAVALQSAQEADVTIEALGASIREISTQVVQASGAARRAVDTGDKARAAIQSLSDAVGRINDVTRLINDIASQTNLLALNATIEAARAGDAGKGFAVVAGEVKSLAGQTAKATEEINRQIADIDAVTKAAVAAVDAIGADVNAMDHVSGAIAAAVEEQAASTQDITRTVRRATEAAQDAAGRIAAASDVAGAAGQRAANVRDLAAALAQGVDELRAALVKVARGAMAQAGAKTP